MKEAEKKMRLQRLGMASVIGLQAFCALVFIWEIVVSVLGLPFNLVPWSLFELVEIGAAVGLLLGIIVGGMVLRNTARRAEAAETRLRAASREFMELLEERFLEWGLTPAERDVALFAFKGLSTAEIAGMRNTSEGTVKAQLLYEISTPAYLNPDVVSHFDTLTIKQTGPDRVRVSGCRGSTPPPTHKVCVNIMGGYRNTMELLLTGLDIEEKAKIFSDALFESIGGRDKFDQVTEQLIRSDKTNPATNEQAFASLKIDVKGSDPKLVGRIFSAKIIELALANFPGFCARTGVGGGGPYVIHWPALMDSTHITEKVHVGGTVTEILPTSQLELEDIYYQKPQFTVPVSSDGAKVKIPLGRLFGTRSGDKGGCANLGVWARTDAAYSFLYHFLTEEKLKELMPDTAEFKIDRYDLPNINALNFVIHGFLEQGVSSSTRIDGQAKSLGEYLRAKLINVPEEITKQIEFKEAS